MGSRSFLLHGQSTHRPHQLELCAGTLSQLGLCLVEIVSVAMVDQVFALLNFTFPLLVYALSKYPDKVGHFLQLHFGCACFRTVAADRSFYFRVFVVAHRMTPTAA